MSLSNDTVSVEILGKNYKIKCPIERTTELRQAAAYVDKEMRQIRDTGKVIGIESIAIITAINIAYQCLGSEHQENKDIDSMSKCILDMQRRIEQALTQSEQLAFIGDEHLL